MTTPAPSAPGRRIARIAGWLAMVVALNVGWVAGSIAPNQAAFRAFGVCARGACPEASDPGRWGTAWIVWGAGAALLALGAYVSLASTDVRDVGLRTGAVGGVQRALLGAAAVTGVLAVGMLAAGAGESVSFQWSAFLLTATAPLTALIFSLVVGRWSAPLRAAVGVVLGFFGPLLLTLVWESSITRTRTPGGELGGLYSWLLFRSPGAALGVAVALLAVVVFLASALPSRAARR